MSDTPKPVSFEIAGQKFEGNAAIGVGLLSASILLYGLRKYFAGGRCNIKKDLNGTIAVLTGGNSGIGKETTKKLMEMGCFVIIGARDESKNNETVKEFSQIGSGKIVAFKLDLADHKSIDEFADNVKHAIDGRPINFLINNAGVMAPSTRRVTKEGFELQMGVSHLGHFYLTYLLWPMLKQAKNPRIINYGSMAHAIPSKIPFDDLGYEKTKYDPWKAYANAKKAVMMFTEELQQRMDAAGMSDAVTISLHPGVCRTELTRYVNESFFNRVFSLVTLPISLIACKSAEQGCQTTMYGILEDSGKLQKGHYYADCKPAKVKADEVKNPQLVKKLWKVSEEAYGIKFDL